MSLEPVPVTTGEIISDQCSEQSNELSPYEQAEHHLDALGGGPFRFLSVREPWDGTGPPPSQRKYGTLADCWEWITQENKNSGIFVLPPHTGSISGSKADVKLYRCLYQEDDHGHGEPQVVLPPTFTIQSSGGKYHRYWVLDEPLANTPAHEAMMGNMQIRMRHSHGSDPAIKGDGLAQSLRLAGTYHRKREPTLVRFAGGSDRRYALNDLLTTFPPVPIQTMAPRAPVATGGNLLKIAEIGAALEVLSTDKAQTENYDAWLTIGMALHHESQGSEEGLQLWHVFSQEADNYNPDVLDYKWRLFSEKREGAVTIGTLFFLAKERGWDGGPKPELVKEQNNRTLQWFSDRFAVVGKESEIWTLKKISEVWQWNRISTKAFAETVTTMTVWTYKNKAWHKEPAFKRWMSHPSRPSFQGTTFVPDRTIYFEDVIANPTKGAIPLAQLPAAMASGNNTALLNTYTGFTVRPVRNPSACALIVDHVLRCFCGGNAEAAAYFEASLGFKLEHPGQQTEKVFHIIGGQGIGKSLLAELITAWYGMHGDIHSSDDSIVGKFNADLAELVVLVLNEASFGGDKKAGGKKKAVTTDRRVRRELKFKDPTRAANFLSLIVMSNYAWTGEVDHDDRRNVFLPTVADFRQGDIAYYIALKDACKNGSSAYMQHCIDRYHQMLADDPLWHPRKAPVIYSQQHLGNIIQTAESSNSVMAFIISRLARAIDNEGECGFVFGSDIREAEYSEIWGLDEPPPLIDKKYLYGRYCGWHEKNKNRFSDPQKGYQQFCTLFMQYINPGMPRAEVRVSSNEWKRKLVYQLPSIRSLANSKLPCAGVVKELLHAAGIPWE